MLWERDGIAIPGIGRQLMRDSGTLTPFLKWLEGLEIVARERRTVDEREVRVWLSPGGMELHDRAREARSGVACRLNVSETEIMALRTDLVALVIQLGAGC